jgi:hypothetical protein
LAFNKERKVKLSAINGSDVVIKSGVIEKELVVAKGSNIVVGGMAVVVLIVEVVDVIVEVIFGGAVVVVCRVKVVGVGVVLLSEIAVGLNTYRKPDAHFL